MTTKAEFDAYVAGFLLGQSSSTYKYITMEQFKTIIAMVDDVVSGEVADSHMQKVLLDKPTADSLMKMLGGQPPAPPWADVQAHYDDAADNVPAMGGSSLDSGPNTPFGLPLGPSFYEQASAPAAEGSDPTVDVMASPDEVSGSAASDGGSSDGSSS